MGHVGLTQMNGAASTLDLPWTRTPLATWTRDMILSHVLGPAIDFYTHARVSGLDNLTAAVPPVLFVSNHSSHLDTPIILKSLPRPWRQRTAVMAAADYFYKNRVLAAVVSLAFGTIPIERRRMSKETADRIEALLEKRWSLLLYPEGTRSRDGTIGRFRAGTGYLAVEHAIPVVPMYLEGTHEAMPPGRAWPVKYPVQLHLGAPLSPEALDDARSFTARLQASFDELVRTARPPPRGAAG